MVENQKVLAKPCALTEHHGAEQKESECHFSLYCPEATQINLLLFEEYNATEADGVSFRMQKKENSQWHLTLPGKHTGKYYAYRIISPKSSNGVLAPSYLIADPWSVEVATINHYRQYGRSRIAEKKHFDWEGDTFVIPPEHRDLIIYEAHIKDLTAHPSSGGRYGGSYAGMAEQGIVGGINHLKRLGVNAVEFLPLQKFAAFEPPFRVKTKEGVYNTWNPYGRNHWGYMTSFFMAPETLYASDGSTRPGAVSGSPEKASLELKEMVKALHREGITVIVDVVFNHVSQYDLNPLKYISKSSFFHTDEKGNFTSQSGCGNDLRTNAPYIRKLLTASVKWWMEEYHIDGFRFDLANLIDRETIFEIKKAAKRINPNVLFIAEPWGGGYDPSGFSQNGISSWNDQIRNGVKGYDPVHSPGFIFGKWHPENNRHSLENYIRGTLIHESNGHFHNQKHTINYLESHDGYTLGDFIRIALDPRKRFTIFSQKSALVPLNKAEMDVARLAALFLMTAQGVPMIHEGQEWARSKWIYPDKAPDIRAGMIDYNSYEKDNETNYLDYSEIAANQPLFDYYQGLIALRKSQPLLRKAPPEEISFHSYTDALHLTFEIRSKKWPMEWILVSLNGNPKKKQEVVMPDGEWEQIVDKEKVFTNHPRPVSGNKASIPPVSGAIFRYKKE